MEDLIEIGYVGKPHALKGELKVILEEAYEDVFFELEVVLIPQKGQNIPYFIEEIRGGNAIIVKFEDIKTKEQAMLISNKTLYMRRSDLPDDFDVNVAFEMDFKYLEGYTLHDKTLGFIAKITEVVEMPQQEMALIKYQNRELFIPLNDELIVSEDEKTKIIVLDIPDGLLDL